MSDVWDVILPEFDLPQPARALTFGSRESAVRTLRAAGFRRIRAQRFPLRYIGSHRFGPAERYRSGEGFDVLVLPRLPPVVMSSWGDEFLTC